MTIHTAEREFTVADGKAILCSGEARYTFTIQPGRPARTWANAADGFSPAERPSIDLTQIEVRFHRSQPWVPVTGHAWDMLISDVPDEWFLEQLEAAA